MKKVISLILAAVMVVSMFAGLQISSSALEPSGRCGENATYTFDSSTGLLTISGSGAMADYDDGDDSIFYNQSGIKNVVINSGVTSIGDCAFIDCSALSSITIPNTVTSIGSYAFYNCTALTSITIPDSVTSIGYEAFSGTGYYNDPSNWSNNVLYIGNHLIKANPSISGAYTIKSGTKTIAYAFYNCSSVTSITIPDSVTSIGSGAFRGCSGLTSITIPNSVTSIGAGAFNNCSSLTSITIPNSVTSIGIDAFYGCTGLTSITIPNSVTSIGWEAFGSCSSLTSITIPDSVTSIGEYAFSGTGYYNDSSNWSNNVLYIGTHLIKANPSISGAYTIKSGTKTIADYAFYNCSSVTSITIPNSVTSIGAGAFNNCSSLTSITIPDSVTSIGGYAFSGTGYYNDPSNWSNNVLYIGNHLIKANPSISGAYTIKSGTKTIADYAFYNCSSVTSITIPDSVTSIGYGAFRGCSGLTSVTIPNSVTSIGEWAFSGCDSLESIYYTGSHEQWSAIIIGKDNEELKNATIHYNYNPDISHAYKTIVTKPKANAVGYTQYKCSCGEFKRTTKGNVYIDKYTSPTGKPSGLKCASRTATSEKFAWSKTSGVSGYQVQISTKDGKKWDKTYNAKTATSYTVKGLTAGSVYKVRVRFYITKNGKNYYGAWASITSPTLPSATSFSKITSARKTFTAQWKKIKNVTGYEIQYAKKSNFSDAKTKKYKSAVKFTIKNKKGGKKYFIRVRTYKTIGGKNYYSAWSKTKTVTTKK